MHTHDMFSWRNKKKISILLVEKKKGALSGAKLPCRALNNFFFLFFFLFYHKWLISYFSIKPYVLGTQQSASMMYFQ